jgi:hypothetical protein
MEKKQERLNAAPQQGETTRTTPAGSGQSSATNPAVTNLKTARSTEHVTKRTAECGTQTDVTAEAAAQTEPAGQQAGNETKTSTTMAAVFGMFQQMLEMLG